jgi:FMN reductase
MPNPTVVGFSGNLTRPSKTRGFVEQVVRDIAGRNNLSAAMVPSGAARLEAVSTGI